MATRLKLTVAYDGEPFAGWQSQTNGNTIQDHLERSFARICKTKVSVQGAGRTDAGVHALAQTAHADVSQTLIPEQWTSALNASLPPSIRVLRCRYVKDAFHARYSARGKIYRYRVWNARILPPLEFGRAWLVAADLNLEAIADEAQVFVGKHDFASFAANRGHPNENTVRTIQFARVKRRGDCITLEFAGDGFLYRMVRLMVGSLVECGRGKSPRGEVRKRLGDRSFVSPRLVAPAAGLFLVRVRY